MKLVAVMGVSGGMGATTIAAQLTAALAQAGRPVLAVDFSPENLLRLHFGMAWSDASGFATELLKDADWHAAARVSAGGISFLPFGQVDSDADAARIDDWFASRPGWFRDQLPSLALADENVVVVDCPRGPASLRAQVLSVADLVLLVTVPDAIAYSLATRITAKIAHSGATPAMMVLNCFDPSHRLDRDISVLLRSAFREHLAPVVIHRDEALGEALACKQNVFDYAPSSQVAYEFSALATWTLARLDQT